MITNIDQKLATLYRPVKKETLDGKTFITNDFGVISEVSDRYTLVQNRDIFEPVINHFGLENVRGIARDGKSFYHVTINTGREFDLGGGDVLKERITIENSYNRTRRFRFILGAFRMVCSNGMYSMAFGLTANYIHLGQIPVNDIVQEALTNYQKNDYSLWRKFKEIPVTQEKAEEIVNQWTPFVAERKPGETHDTPTDVLNRRVKSRTMWLINRPESLDNQRNGWGVFNQMNRSIADHLQAKGQHGRRVLGDGRAESFLTKLFNIN